MSSDAEHAVRDAASGETIHDSPAVEKFGDLAHAHGGPLGVGRIRSRPEDFIVRERLGFAASGDGEHVVLTVRKREANSKWVARQIAARAGVRVREVGLAGLKDRHAITEQSFTVPALKTAPADWLGFAGEGFLVIAAERQRRKLRRGAHKGNDFEIVVRDFAVDPRRLDSLLSRIAAQGVPNYFGEQRFGRDDGNLRIAEQWFCNGALPQDRDLRGFALSAARSALFNAVLSARVQDRTWNRLLSGEVVNLDGSGSVFVLPDVDAASEERCGRLDIHPTGPLCGVGDSRASGAVAALEAQVLAPWQSWCDALIRLNVEQARRPLRVAVNDLSWEYSRDVLRMRFALNRGSFATAVLREIISSINTVEGAYE